MKSKTENRFIEMAQCFHEMAPYMVPQYDWMQDQAINLMKEGHPMDGGYLIDLGGGSGRMVKKYLDTFPNSRACIVDSSPSFLNLAKKFLSPEAHRVDYIQREIEGEWESRISSAPNVIFSMSCIHHLTHVEKQKVYHKACQLLRPSGWFINVDETKGHSESAYFEHLYAWWNRAHQIKQSIPSSLIESYTQFMKHFENWKIRNLDKRDTPKKKGDDLHESVYTQLDGLKQCHLKNVDVYFSYRLWSALAGKK